MTSDVHRFDISAGDDVSDAGGVGGAGHLGGDLPMRV